LIVTVKEELLSRPLMAPDKTGKGNRVELFPLDRLVLESGGPRVGYPMTCIKDAITKTTRGIREEFQI